jgi:uncharacterized membrane protein
MIDRSSLKADAADLCKTSKPSLILVGLIYALLTIVMSTLSSRVMSAGITISDADRFLNAFYSGNYETAFALLDRVRPPASSYMIDGALRLVMMIVSAGFTIFVLNTIRNAGAVYGNLLDGFSMAGRIILLNLLEGILVFLWSLLLLVPGIVAAYRYSQAIYILLDHPEKSVLECIRESKELMRGRKGELFKIDLSLLGWAILGAFIPFVTIWTAPYIRTIHALYHMELTGEEPGGNLLNP